MKNLIITLVIAIVELNSCKSVQKSVISQQPKAESKLTDSLHNSQNSTDWDGIYRGALPCADCEGIQTTIYLERSLTFTVKTRYMGKSDSVYVNRGRISWSNEGNTITLIPDDKGQNIQYSVGENMLTQLDMQGNKITGEVADRYILTKSNYAILEKYWKLVELNGKPVEVDSTFNKEPFIIFKESNNRMSGNGGCNNISGSFQIEGLNRITFSKIISTRMSCPRMDLEGEFLEVLQKADNFIITGDMLVMNKARMAPLARFKIVYM